MQNKYRLILSRRETQNNLFVVIQNEELETFTGIVKITKKQKAGIGIKCLVCGKKTDFGFEKCYSCKDVAL